MGLPCSWLVYFSVIFSSSKVLPVKACKAYSEYSPRRPATSQLRAQATAA